MSTTVCWTNATNWFRDIMLVLRAIFPKKRKLKLNVSAGRVPHEVSLAGFPSGTLCGDHMGHPANDKRSLQVLN